MILDKKKLLEEIKDLQEEKATVIQSLDVIKSELSTQRDALGGMDKIMSDIQRDIGEKRNVIAGLDTEIKEKTILYNNMIKEKKKLIKMLQIKLDMLNASIAEAESIDVKSVTDEYGRYKKLLSDKKRELVDITEKYDSMKKEMSVFHWERMSFDEYVAEEKANLESREKDLAEKEKRVAAYAKLLHDNNSSNGKD